MASISRTAVGLNAYRSCVHFSSNIQIVALFYFGLHDLVFCVCFVNLFIVLLEPSDPFFRPACFCCTPSDQFCEDNFPPLGYFCYQSDEKRISLRDRDPLRNDPQWVPGFLSCCSWMFQERLRNKSELVGSEETRQVLTMHPRYETLSYWIVLRVSSLLSLRCLQKPRRYSFEPIQGQACSLPYCRWLSLIPQSCHKTEGKVLSVMKT